MSITLENFIEQKFYNKFYDNIETLKKIAGNSPLQHKHSACLMKGDKIITMGYNKYLKESIINNNIVCNCAEVKHILINYIYIFI